MQVTIATPAGQTARGEKTDVSPKGMTVAFTGKNLPVFPLASELWVLLETRDRSRPIKLAATCEKRWDDSRGRRYGLKFAGTVDLSHLHTLGVVGLINQRGSFRVQPPEGLQIPVVVHSPDEKEKAKAELADLSEGGMGVLAPAWIEAKMAASESMRTTLRLPGGDIELTTISAVVYRGLSGDRIRYGLAFDREATPHFPAVQNRIAAFVMKRQREILAGESIR